MNKVRKINKFNILIITLSILFIASILNFAGTALQDDSNTKVNEMTKKLDKKLLLSEKQQTDVKTILLEYFNKLSSSKGNSATTKSLRKDTNTKIVSLLDDRQKMKFEIIENDWWTLAEK
jgi:uncharacterized membrane-anchored protein